MLHSHDTKHHRTHSARLQLVAHFNFLVVGDTATTHAPLPIGTLSRPSDRVFMFESSSVRMVFDNVSVPDMRAYILSRFVHHYDRGASHVCPKCATVHVGRSGHRGRNKTGCLHCLKKLHIASRFK